MHENQILTSQALPNVNDGPVNLFLLHLESNGRRLLRVREHIRDGLDLVVKDALALGISAHHADDIQV
jgi:hypothetical protein